MKTREQQRAYDAYERVQARESSPHKADYGRVCVHLPEMIHRNGLCQTVAFLEAKSGGTKPKPWFAEALADLADVTKLAPAPKKFPAEVRNAQLTEYQRFTREALACAQWLKRYAEAVLKVDASQKVSDR
jgi:CRISPR-associated protein Cmr5